MTPSSTSQDRNPVKEVADDHPSCPYPRSKETRGSPPMWVFLGKGGKPPDQQRKWTFDLWKPKVGLFNAYRRRNGEPT